MSPDEKQHVEAHSRDLPGPDAVAQALKHGPVGALVVASIAAGLLFIGWLAFYFLLFLPRGAVG
jgi:hypothetical protein